jgi:hypothetical protein
LGSVRLDRYQGQEYKMTVQFVVGTTYATRSICDHDCIFQATIVKRTDKSVWISRPGRDYVARKSISVYEGVEQFAPNGRHSMCAIIGADRTLAQVVGGA